MRKAVPSITESADELQQCMKSEPDLKKRQRLHALYLAASGQARQRQEIAALLGVHRHSVAAWFQAYTEGGLERALSYQIAPAPCPPAHDPQGVGGPPGKTARSTRLCWLSPHSRLVGRGASGDVGVFERPCLGAVQAARQTKTAPALPRKKSLEAVTQFQTTLPTLLTQQLADRSSTGTIKVFAQDETRLGLLPMVRRRITSLRGPTYGHCHAPVRQFLSVWRGRTDHRGAFLS